MAALGAIVPPIKSAVADDLKELVGADTPGISGLVGRPVAAVSPVKVPAITR